MDSAQAKILVVDDNAENRALARATLEDEGYDVLLAATGESGICLFEEQRPDCLLLDVRMPGTDGFAVCARVRALPGGEHTPVVFLTALRDVDTFDRALKAGGDDFLTKPVRPAELVIRVRAALKLRRMSAELAEHYALVRQQRDDLMRLTLQKERLTSFVVHDLKSPVNTLDLYAQLLLEDRTLPERARNSVQHIRDEARSLLRLVLNLLDISKSEEGQLMPALTRVDLAALIGEIRDAFSMRAKSAGIDLALEVGASAVTADADLLRRVLENLVDNAIRHSPEGSAIVLVSVQRESGVEIRVADGGPGIAAAARDKVFERFVQLDNEPALERRGGRGLGLAFCKLAVEAHGGTIWVEDGRPGAVFCLRLPV
jgi:two-component system, sensor histidine kinase and response regulator